MLHRQCRQINLRERLSHTGWKMSNRVMKRKWVSIGVSALVMIITSCVAFQEPISGRSITPTLFSTNVAGGLETQAEATVDDTEEVLGTPLIEQASATITEETTG